jgi:23S rRNA (cytosine1962-C5)-methyltransferase
MANNDFPVLRLKKNEERRIYAGHLWAFSNEFVEVPKNIDSGSVVRIVRDLDERFVAFGFFNPHSLITARILSRDPNELIDTGFFRKRLSAAAARRASLLTLRNSARLVHSESDLLPGLVIDKFDEVIAFQISSAGFETRKEALLSLIEELWNPRAIIEKNSSHVRAACSRRVFGSHDRGFSWDNLHCRYTNGTKDWVLSRSDGKSHIARCVCEAGHEGARSLFE